MADAPFQITGIIQFQKMADQAADNAGVNDNEKCLVRVFI